MAKSCSHIETLAQLKVAARHECATCVTIGSTWMHLRTCQTCGITLCCDSSPHRHASKHAHHEHHPVASSAEPGERWVYCYEDDSFAEY